VKSAVPRQRPALAGQQARSNPVNEVPSGVKQMPSQQRSSHVWPVGQHVSSFINGPSPKTWVRQTASTGQHSPSQHCNSSAQHSRPQRTPLHGSTVVVVGGDTVVVVELGGGGGGTVGRVPMVLASVRGAASDPVELAIPSPSRPRNSVRREAPVPMSLTRSSKRDFSMVDRPLFATCDRAGNSLCILCNNHSYGKSPVCPQQRRRFPWQRED